jgi:LDH2 family malate/lactate/ureidoglycolate dehydrogenase
LGCDVVKDKRQNLESGESIVSLTEHASSVTEQASKCRIPAHRLRQFAQAVLEQVEVPRAQAADAADVLVWANLHGVDTHGVRNLRPLYVKGIESGRIKARAEFRVEYETSVTARVDGDQGLGLAAGPWGMRLAMAKAKEHGVGIVAVRNSHHYGAAGYHANLAVAQDMIGISLTGHMWPKGSPIGVLPTFGKVPMLSTNPIAVAVPSGVEAPFLLDMATSITPYNRVMLYREVGQPLPEGWALDENGLSTTDPAVAKQLLPLGGSREFGGHKGYGLSVMVEIFCALLSGAWDKGEEGYAQSGDGHFLMAMRVDAFRPIDDFKTGMDAMIDAFHQSPAIEGRERVMVAGEPEAKTAQRRSQIGVPLPPNVQEDLAALSEQYHVPLEFELA